MLKLKLDTGNEELRSQINTLKYELENINRERELASLQHERGLRELQIKADTDFKKAQVRLSFRNSSQ